MRRSASARRRAGCCRRGDKNDEKNGLSPLFPRRACLRAALGLWLLPAVRAGAGALPAVPRAARVLLCRWRDFSDCRLALSRARRERCVLNPRFPLRRRRRGHGLAPGVAAAPASRQGAAVRAGPFLHAGELPARAGAEEARLRQRRVRGGGLDLPRPVDRRVVARLVRASRPLRALARGARDGTARGVAKTTLRDTPQRVRETFACAVAASAAVTPGTISTGIRFSTRKLISSWARPKSIGSPPFRRTTTRWRRAASASRLLMKRCALECRP